MYCLNCGKELRPGVAFCASCGAPVQAQGAPQAAPAAPAPQGVPRGVASPQVPSFQGVAQPYGQQPYGGFASTAGTVASSMGAVFGLSFSQLIAVIAAIIGLLLFAFSPWLDLPVAATAQSVGVTGIPSSLRMSAIDAFSELSVLFKTSEAGMLPASFDNGGITFICTLWRLSIIFTVYCTVNVIRHKKETLLLQVALGIMSATALFWIIGVSIAHSDARQAIAPAWGAIVSLIVCGLGLVGSIFFGIGERQRR